MCIRIFATSSRLGELEWVKLMDRNNIAVCVSLDGQWGELVDEHAKLLWTKHKDRFVMFGNIDWQGSGKADDPASWDCQRPDFARRIARQLAADKARGICGVKIFKGFGLEYKTPTVRSQDRRPAVDDGTYELARRVDSCFDPVAFFSQSTNKRVGRTAPPARLELSRSTVS
jgi:hypothetical protein